jgi:hypothetical protein
MRLVLAPALILAACGGRSVRASAGPAPSPSCADLPAGFEPFAALGWGDALYDTGTGDREAALSRFFPEIDAANGRVVMVTPVEVDGSGDAPEMAAAYIPEGGTREGGDFDVVHDYRLGLFRCGASGFVRITRDLAQPTGTEIRVLETQVIALPDGRWGSSLRLTHARGAEMVMVEHVLGRGGELGTFEVGRSFVPDGGGTSYWRVVDGSGWFTDRRALRYVGLSYSYEPDVPDAKSLYLDAAVLAILDGGGLRADDIDTDGWALFGAGEPPAWCGEAVRCARIDPDDAAVAAPPGTRFAYAWMASGWATADAARAAIQGAGGDVSAGDWAFLGLVEAFEGEEPPTAPDGEPPSARLEFIRDGSVPR